MTAEKPTKSGHDQVTREAVDLSFVLSPRDLDVLHAQRIMGCFPTN